MFMLVGSETPCSLPAVHGPSGGAVRGSWVVVVDYPGGSG
jgi:hypothetical protein